MAERINFLPLMVGAVALASTTPSRADAGVQERPWWEKSNCHGLEGVSWVQCQKAISQNKRDRQARRLPSNQAWWEASRCLGLKGANWTTCQTARREKGHRPGRAVDPWVKRRCLGLTGLSFVECRNELKRERLRR